MDIESLTNHISRLGKDYFNNACKIVLQDVFQLNAINVDGKGDGGSDFSAFSSSGERLNVGYQITTQKTGNYSKAIGDAKKAIEKLNISRYYFITTYNLEEVDIRLIEDKISKELGINAICFTPKYIAGFILKGNLLNKFLDENNYPLPREYTSSYDYRERALHSYTILSDDASQMKSSIYDDSILLQLSNGEKFNEEELIINVMRFLELDETKADVLKKRISALFGKQKIIKLTNGNIELNPETKKDFEARKEVYQRELLNLSAAQTDLLVTEYHCKWTEEDSKKVAMWIAKATIAEKIETLKEAKVSITINPLFSNVENGIHDLRNFLIKEKKISKSDIDSVIEKLLCIASNHPLISKIARASVYLALEGSNPITSAKALGANRWSDINILVEPTVAIPYICSQLYQGRVNKFFDLSIKSVHRALKLDARLFIPFFYITECAGHLLRARRYDGLNLDEKELVFSSNAFVANYFALKNQGIKLPDSFMAYLSSFSPAIQTERSDISDWIRAIMTDLQSILTRGRIEFLEVPFYEAGDCKSFEIEYMHRLHELNIEKKSNLISHDVYALQFANDAVSKHDEHWIILTYDTSMISISRSDLFSGWITNPIKFLDFSENSKSLSESKLVSLVHSFATYSERTLSAGARVIDRVIAYASSDMQNWEFKQEIEKFKKETIESINLDRPDYITQVDTKTDEFLKKHGVELKAETESTEIE